MSKGDKSDLTRLEDLGHFEHLEDPEIDQLLTPHKKPAKEPVSLDDLANDSTSPDITSEMSGAFTSDESNVESEEVPELPSETSKDDAPPSFDGGEISFDAPAFEESAEAPPELPSQDENEDSFAEPVFSESFGEEPKIEEVPQTDEVQFSATVETPPPTTTNRAPLPPLSFEEELIEKPVYKVPEPSTPRRKPEDFQDVKNFAQSISYGKVSVGGNPPYSLMLKGIRYKDDGEEILSILEEHGLITQETENAIHTGIKHGAVLISQISEYSAVYLAHKLRRFNVDIMVGLSEELHHSKSYENDQHGTIQKDQLMQNHEEDINLDETPIALENIILTTTPTLPGYKVSRYVDILTDQATISEEELTEADSNLEQTQVYAELVSRLKTKAFKLRCNAILGVNFQFLPIPSSAQPRYKIVCTGNAVLLSDL